MKNIILILTFFITCGLLSAQSISYELNYQYEQIVSVEDDGSLIVAQINETNDLLIDKLSATGQVTRVDSFRFSHDEHMYPLNQAFRDSLAYLSFGAGHTQTLFQYDLHKKEINWKKSFEVGADYSELFNVELMPFKDEIAIISGSSSEDPGSWYQYDLFNRQGIHQQNSLVLLENIAPKAGSIHRSFFIDDRIIYIEEKVDWLYAALFDEISEVKYTVHLMSLAGDALDELVVKKPLDIHFDKEQNILLEQINSWPEANQLEGLRLLSSPDGLKLSQTEDLVEHLEFPVNFRAISSFEHGFIGLQTDKDADDSTVLHLTHRNSDLSLKRHLICPKIKGDFRDYDFHVVEREDETKVYIQCISGLTFNRLAPQKTVAKTVVVTWSEEELNNLFFQELDLYPNPSEGKVFVQAEISGKLDVFNSSGQLILSKNKHCREEVYDLSFLPAGVYILNLSSYDQKTIKTGKLILK